MLKVCKLIQFYAYLPLIFILANLFRLLAIQGTLEKTYFQADYAIPILLAAILKRSHLSKSMSAFLISPLVLFFIVNDAILVYAKTFRWDVYTLPQYIISFQDLPWNIIWPISVLITMSVILLSIIILFSYNKSYSIASLIFLISTLQFIDMKFGTSRFKDDTSGIDLITSSFFVTFPAYIVYATEGASFFNFDEESLFSYVSKSPRYISILSVSVESLGLTVNREYMTNLAFPIYDKLGNIYNIERHDHKFFGSTLQGEVRELCSARLIGNASEKKIIRRLRRCLPMTLQAKGYATEALHGNGGRFYNRRAIYPAMGFQRSWFYDDIVAADRSAGPCPKTAFSAVCDDRLYARALSLFNGRRRFVHVMTLDSHLPVPDVDGLTCPQAFSDDKPLCAYANLISRSLDELGSAIAAASYKPDLIFIYGDHAPPFSKSTTRGRFTNDKVPFFVLTKKI